jgi:hypothetical protein
MNTGIPDRWTDLIVMRDEIVELAGELLSGPVNQAVSRNWISMTPSAAVPQEATGHHEV